MRSTPTVGSAGYTTALVLPLLALASCKPPPTDADIAASEMSLPDGPSEPITSPDTEGALWAESQTTGRLLYGKAEKPSLLAIACIEEAGTPVIRITRFAAADENAQGVAALIGNGHIARIPIDASEIDGAWLWRADVPAGSPDLEVLTGRREAAVTIPGAGRLVLNPSERPGQLIENCRAEGAPADDSSEGAATVR